MSEILQIIIQFFFILFIFLFPFNGNFLFKKKLNTNTYSLYSLYDLICFNIIFHFIFILFFSFFLVKIDLLQYYLILIFFLSFINFFFNLIKDKKYFKFQLLFFILFCLIFLTLIFGIASQLRLGWDSVAHWFWKANLFFQNGNIYDFRELPYPFYPHLGTYIWALFWKTTFLQFEYLGRFVYAFVFLASIFSILSEFIKKNNYFIVILICVLAHDSFAMSGYQEFMIFFIVTFAARIFFLIEFKIQKKSQINFVGLFFILSLLLLTNLKQEGVIVSLFLTISSLFLKNLTNRYKLLSFFIGLLIIFFHYLSEIYLKGSFDFHEPIVNNELLKYRDIKLLFDNFFIITHGLIIAIFSRPIFLISLFMIFYLLLSNRFSYSDLLYLISFFILNILLVYAIYLHTSYGLSIIGPTLDRILLEFQGFYLVLFSYLFIKKNIKLK